ncbi:MAG: ABC transporter permease subunit [Acidobacteria bacterium]|nr:ABC transporter permease subunit [Acidobacteriota bacterium]
MRLAIVRTIVATELTETLRDRRTIMMMIALPVLLYPLIMIGFSKLQVSQREAIEGRTSRVAVWGGTPEGLATALVRDGNVVIDSKAVPPAVVTTGLATGVLQRPALPPSAPASLPESGSASSARAPVASPPPEPEHPVLAAARALVVARSVDAVLVFWPDVPGALASGRAGSVSIYYDSVREDSLEAQRRLAERLLDFRKALVRDRERAQGLVEGFSVGLDIRSANVAPEERRTGQLLGLFLPFLLVTMSLLGGFYPAIDLTAGEKERGTMQTLLCAPLSPVEIITGKFIAVWITSLIAALANVVSLGATMMRILPGDSISVAPSTFILAFVMLLPVTFFITAIFLALATFAKDFKDGQNFLTPVYMLLALPAGVTMLRGIELNAWTAFVPVVNIALLIKALLISEAAPDLIFLALVSSTAYAVLAVLLAARVFEREQVLLGGRDSVRSLLGFERRAGAFPSPTFALSAFALILVLVFYGSLLLRDAGTVVTLLVTEFGFFLLPTLLLVAAFGFPLRRTLSLRRPPLMGLVAAVLIGSSAWAVAGGVLIRLLPPPESLVRALEQLLLLDGKPASLWVVWLVIGVTPAICEETFFRGLILSGLRKAGPWPAIVGCALLFGLAHSSIYRLLPTAFIGLLLTWLVWRTGSIWTSIVAHMLNNGIAATLVYNKSLAAMFGAADQAFLGWRPTAMATVVLLVGIGIVWRMRPFAYTPTESTIFPN